MESERKSILMSIGEMLPMLEPWQVVLDRDVATEYTYGYYTKDAEYTVYINDGRGFRHIVYTGTNEIGVLRYLQRKLKAQAKLSSIHQEIARQMQQLHESV